MKTGNEKFLWEGVEYQEGMPEQKGVNGKLPRWEEKTKSKKKGEREREFPFSSFVLDVRSYGFFPFPFYIHFLHF